MKYRIQIQQVFGGNWASLEEATAHAEWLECDNIKPRSRVQGLAALEEQANLYKNGAPHRLVALHNGGTFEVHYTITRGTAFFPAPVRPVVDAITRANATETPAAIAAPLYAQESLTEAETLMVINARRDQQEDFDLTAAQLDDKYNQEGDGECPSYPRADWRQEVADESTISGYWEWVAHNFSFGPGTL